MSTNSVTTDLRSTPTDGQCEECETTGRSCLRHSARGSRGRSMLDASRDPSSFNVAAPGLWYAYGLPGVSFGVVDLSRIDPADLAGVAAISDLELKIAQAHLDQAQSVVAAAMHRRTGRTS